MFMDDANHSEPGPVDVPADLRPRFPAVASAVQIGLNRVQRRMRQYFVAELQARTGFGLPDWRVLVVLGHLGPLPQKDIVEAADMEQGAVSKALGRLGAQGLVAEARDGHDRRVWRFRLTDAGQDAFTRNVPAMRVVRDRLEGLLAPEQRMQLLSLMGDLSARLAVLEAEAREHRAEDSLQPEAGRVTKAS